MAGLMEVLFGYLSLRLILTGDKHYGLRVEEIGTNVEKIMI